ncbi:MAG: hypothetical protein Q9227_001350 [Pyrenula ochraceoflavens]
MSSKDPSSKTSTSTSTSTPTSSQPPSSSSPPPPQHTYNRAGELLPDVAAKWGYTPKDPQRPLEPHGYSEEEAEKMRKKGVNPDLKWEMERERREGNRSWWGRLTQFEISPTVFQIWKIMKDFNPLTTTASDLQKWYADGSLTCEEAVEVYLKQIIKFNHRLRAVIQTTPLELLQKHAKELDSERKSGKPTGPLHGIPILIKDNIDTDPALGLGTTAGSFSLLHARPRQSAPLVRSLLAAGAIVLGKANLSEFAWILGDCNPCGWSAVGGQTQSAYVSEPWHAPEPCSAHSNCGGSSSGSAVSVSAGFAPVSIGTETGGSLVMPANRAALWTMKPSIGLVSQQGIVPISDFSDAAGPMTTCVKDLADLLEILVDEGHRDRIPEGGYANQLKGSWEGLKVGLLDPKDWPQNEQTVGKDDEFVEQQLDEIEKAYKKLEELGVKVKKPVSLISTDELKLDEGNALFDLWKNNLARLMDTYLKTLEYTPVKNLKEIVAFNKTYNYCQLPPGINQDYLLRAADCSYTLEQSKRAIAHCRQVARDLGIDKTLRDNDIDVIIGPADSSLTVLVAAAGYPIASLPLSTYKGNGRPFGLVVMAGQWQEGLLIRVMSAWEKSFPVRAVPNLTVGDEVEKTEAVKIFT